MSLSKNVVANFIGQGWNALMGIAFLPLYIEYLGMEAYGLIGVYSMMQAWLLLLDMGMTPTLNREMARFSAGEYAADSIRQLLRTLECLCLAVALVVAVAVCLLSGWLAESWLRVDKLPVLEAAHAIAVIGIVVALRLVESLYRGAIAGLQRQVWLNAISIAMATARWGGAVVVLLISPSIEAFFVWQGWVSVISIAAFAGLTYRLLPASQAAARFSWQALSTVRTFATGMAISTLLAILLTQVDKLLLSRLLNLEDFARYTFAVAVAGALLPLVMPVSNAYSPRMVELLVRRDRAGLARTYHQGAQLITVLIAPPAVLMALYGESVIRLWTGNSALSMETAPLLSILAVGTMLNAFMYMPYAALLANGKAQLSARINFVAVVLLIPGVFWGATHYGAIGAAWAWVALNAGYVAIGSHTMHKEFLPREWARWLIDDLSTPAISCISAMSLGYCFFKQVSILGIAAALLLGWSVSALSSRFLRGAMFDTMALYLRRWN